MTLGDLTAAHRGKVVLIEDRSRLIVSVRHYGVGDPEHGGDFTSVIHCDPAAKPSDPAAEYRGLSSTPIEVRGG